MNEARCLCPKPSTASDPPTAGRLLELGATLGVTAVSTLVAWLLCGRQALPDVVMVYLLGVVALATRFSAFASLLGSILSVLAYDFFFVPPYLSFTVYERRHLVTFMVMFAVAVMVTALAQQVREQAVEAHRRERHTARLNAMIRELSAVSSVTAITAVGLRHLQAVFDGEVVLLMPGTTGAFESTRCLEPSYRLDNDVVRSAEVAWERDDLAAGLCAVLPSCSTLFIVLRGARGRIGALGVVPRQRERLVDDEERRMIEAFAAQLAVALDRACVAREAEEARIEAEAERLQSSLLSSVSHDFRSPLAVITGAATTLLTQLVAPDAQRDMLSAICDESGRLTRLVTNLLDMTRLAAGAMKVKIEWQSIEAVVGAAIRRLEARLGGRSLHVHVPADLPLVPFDAVLVEQALINLLENAAKYSPPGTPIDVSVLAERLDEVVLAVEDRGQGVPASEKQRIFDKFYRLPGASGSGAGLGLAICRGIVEAHGGRIWVADREGGGCAFRFTLPVKGSPPMIDEERDPA